MKKIAVLILIVLFLKPIFPVLEYAVNYDYISQVLCINKDKPALQCNGKCHLMKELAKAADDDKATDTPSNNKKTSTAAIDLFIANVNEYVFAQLPFRKDPLTTSKYANFYKHIQCNTIFRPPIVIS